MSENPINIQKLHTTFLGVKRIKKNLNLNVDNVVDWCKAIIANTDDKLTVRKGKNWYVQGDGFVLTINAHSNTIITGHLKK